MRQRGRRSSGGEDRVRFTAEDDLVSNNRESNSAAYLPDQRYDYRGRSLDTGPLPSRMYGGVPFVSC